MRKGLLSVIVSAVLVFGLWPGAAVAQEGDLVGADVGSMQPAASSQDKEAGYVAYNGKMEELVATYGEPDSWSPYSWITYAKGVGFAALLDVDGDGADEMLVARDEPKGSYGNSVFEIWDYAGGKLECDFSGKLSGHGTNGWFPYVELYERTDTSGYAYMVHGCLGSSPVVLTEELFGYSGGSFVSLGKRISRDATASGGAVTYYSDYDRDAGSDYLKGQLTESQYKNRFNAYLGSSSASPAFHIHLFSSPGSGFDSDGVSLSGALATAKSVIARLKSAAEQRDISNAEIWLDNAPVDGAIYMRTGRAIKPSVTVYAKQPGEVRSRLLSPDQYDVAYQNNVSLGTATVIVTGKGNWTGRAHASFEIVLGNTSKYSVAFDTYGFRNSGKRIDKKFCQKLFGKTYGKVLYDNKVGAGGLCFGMVATAIASKSYGNPRPNTYSNPSNGQAALTLNQVGEKWRSDWYGMTALDYIKCGWLTQIDPEIATERNINSVRWSSDPSSLYQDVENNIDRFGEPLSLYLKGSDGEGEPAAHELWVIGIGNNDRMETELRVYDCNHPGETRVVTLLKDGKGNYSGEWLYDTGLDGFPIWGSAVGDIFADLTWSTPGDYLAKMMNRNGDVKFDKYGHLISTNTSAILRVSGTDYNLASYSNEDADRLLRVNVSDGQFDRKASYWLDCDDELYFSGFADDASVSVASDDGGMEISVVHGSAIDLITDEEASNSVSISQPDNSRFEIEYFDDNGGDELDSVTLSGVGGESVETRQANGDVEVSGVSQLVVANDQGEKTRRVNLEEDVTYTVIPGDENTKPEIVVDKPWAPAFDKKVVAIDAAGDHSAAILEDGSLWAWGCNDNGQIGDGTFEDRSTPVKVMDDVAAVSLGKSHSAALKTDGTMWAWGRNKYGQVGDGTTFTRTRPVQVMEDVKAIELGAFSTSAIKNDNTFWVWGFNGQIDLGLGEPESPYDCVTTPTMLAQNVSTASLGLHAGGYVTADGDLYTWGANLFHGNVGNGTNSNVYTPTRIMADVASVEMGELVSSAAIKKDGSLWTWGNNAYGMLGDGETGSRNEPEKVADGASSVSLGDDFTLVLFGNELKVCGANRYGQLGLGTPDASATSMTDQLSDAIAVAAGDLHGLALDVEGNIYSWGRNNKGQLGNGATVDNGTAAIVGSGALAAGVDAPLIDISNATVKNVVDASYSGSVISQSPIVVLDGKMLDEGWDYEISYSDNVDAGTASMTVDGKGVYIGSQSLEFTIEAIDLSNAVVTVPDQVYDGKAKTPEPIVKLNERTLIEGIDYTVAGYSNNTNAGRATVRVRGAGNYSGEALGAFTIQSEDDTPSKISLSEAAVSVSPTQFTYDGTAKEPHVTVSVDGVAVPATGYSVEYSNNVNVGTVTVTVKGLGAYTGEAYAVFQILAAPGGGSGSGSPGGGSNPNVGGSSAPGSQTAGGGPSGNSGSQSDSDAPPDSIDGNLASGGGGGEGAEASSAMGDTNEADGAVMLPMHRLYNPWSGEHFYTADESERDSVIGAGWTYEGIGWNAPSEGNAVFRVYNPYAGEHHYTLDAVERDGLVAAGWTDEGIGWYSDAAQRTPLYREYNPYMFSCNHNYTTNKDEHDYLVGLGWVDEGVAWYGA